MTLFAHVWARGGVVLGGSAYGTSGECNKQFTGRRSRTMGRQKAPICSFSLLRMGNHCGRNTTQPSLSSNSQLRCSSYCLVKQMRTKKKAERRTEYPMRVSMFWFCFCWQLMWKKEKSRWCLSVRRAGSRIFTSS